MAEKNKISKPVPNLIMSAFDEVSVFAVSRKLSKMSVWEICTVRDYTFMRTAVEKNRLFKILHKNAAQIFEKSWRYYAVFLEAINRVEASHPQMGEISSPALDPITINKSPVIIDSSVPTKDYSLDAFYRLFPRFSGYETQCY